MNPFRSVREAKEYLIQQILDQADRDAAPLSDIERKMLYFTETGWTLPNMMAISEEFDHAYDQNEYERKIGHIIRRMHDRVDRRGDGDHWDKAVQCLREEDHYLLVLIDGALRHSGNRPRWDMARLV